jgi:7,8-dihydropterin-6-yl-methyl-4-(beta-D-ribofuranosyl)aminobenzene 5'-phosphate synthase
MDTDSYLDFPFETDPPEYVDVGPCENSDFEIKELGTTESSLFETFHFIETCVSTFLKPMVTNRGFIQRKLLLYSIEGEYLFVGAMFASPFSVYALKLRFVFIEIRTANASPTPNKQTVMKPLKITILVDDKAPDNLVAEHGFAVWIEAFGRNILFDTGKGTAIVNNADILDIPLDKTNILVLSHGHYDHTGGLLHVVERAPAARIYCHPDVKEHRFIVREKTAKAIGLPEASRSVFDSLFPERVHWITQPHKIGSHIGLTGPVPRATMYEDAGGPFYFDATGMHEDSFEDDMALWISTPKGLIVVVGCCHAGIINTLLYIRHLMNNNARIRAVVGGFHLLASSNTRVEQTVDALLAINPELVVPCHCTGEAPIAVLRRHFENRISIGHAGATFDID